MRTHLSIVAAALPILTVNALQTRQNDVNITALLNLPQCIQDCGLTLFPQYSCTPQQPCYCETTGPLTDALAACALSQCPQTSAFSDALAAQKFQADTCNFPVRNKTAMVEIIPYTLFAIATISLFARFLSRWQRLQGAGFSYDDWVIVFCYFPVVGMTIVAYFEARYGSGQDMWERSIIDVRNFLLWFYAGQAFYLAVTYLTKVSLVLLYLRIWPEFIEERRSPFRITCWVCLGMLLATWIATTLATIFACRPMSYAWNMVIGAEGECIDRPAAVYVYAALNIAYDFVVLLLPIPRLLRLKVTTGEKIGISATFLVGFIVTACSIIRLTRVQGLAESRNVTWDFAPAGLWSLIEVYCSLICCCMPAMAGLVKRCWRYVRNKESTYASKYSDPSSTVTEMDKWKGESVWKDQDTEPGLRAPSATDESQTALVSRALSPVTTQEVESWRSY